MANEKVSQMPSLGAGDLAPEDVFYIIDMSQKQSKKLSAEDLLAYAAATGSFNALHAVNADTASYIQGSGVNGTVISSSFSSNTISASYARKASLADNATSASWAPPGPSSGTTLFTGSTYPITSSWTNFANISRTSSFLLYSPGSNTGTASYALTASTVISASYSSTSSVTVSSSYSVTSSYTDNAASASFVPPTAYTVPAGTVITYAANSAPAGWLECNGSAISRNTYSVLFATIGTTWGSGDGSTTFNIPDLRGYFVRGWDDGRGIDTGRSFASIQADSIKDHSHGVQANSFIPVFGGNDLSSGNDKGGTTSTAGVNAPNAGGTETRPKNISLMYCIKY